MFEYTTRRRFVEKAATGISALAGGMSFLNDLPQVSAQEAVLNPGIASFDSNIEPLVRVIEDTPRNELLEEIANLIHHGRSYREILAALLLAGIRNVQPRPSVGFKFHCVLVVNSCHLASLSGPDEDRWLPIFWALDYFKSSQADEARNSGWKLKPVNESLVPDALQAQSMFTDAMDNWDEAKADAAITGLVRTTGATQVFNLLARYAARDYRSIGHKAIYLANAWRTLQVIGWQFAEPVLRSLTFALLNHSGEPNPSTNDLSADRPWRQNAELIGSIPNSWLSGSLDDEVPTALFSAFRNGSPTDASRTAVDALSKGVSTQSVWDGIFVGAGELLMRQPGIIGLHGLTTANAMHYLWSNVADDNLRRRLLLQACSFNVMFRDSAKGRGRLSDAKVDNLEPATTESNGEAIPEIIAAISGNRMQAAGKVYGYLSAGGNGHEFVRAARQMLFVKGRDAHDYKFASAVLEDFNHISPAWRDRFLATSVFNLKGSGHPDNRLVTRIRSAVKS